MSRPILALFLLPALAAPLAGCATPYSRMYSPAKSYYKAPPEPEKNSDADKLPPVDGATIPGAGPAGGLPPGTPPGELAPPPLGDPGLPVPAADPLNMTAPPAVPPPL